jgi:hypothetical protein
LERIVDELQAFYLKKDEEADSFLLDPAKVERLRRLRRDGQRPYRVLDGPGRDQAVRIASDSMPAG